MGDGLKLENFRIFCEKRLSLGFGRLSSKYPGKLGAVVGFWGDVLWGFE